jgi:hypothetical protein
VEWSTDLPASARTRQATEPRENAHYPEKTVYVTPEPGGKKSRTGKDDEPVKNGAGSLAGCA